jgi:hypothetical protein
MVGRLVRVEARRVAPLARQPHDAGETGARERVERVVDGGEAHRRKLGPQPLEKVLGRGMGVVAGEEADDRDSLRRELQARSPQVAQHVRGSTALRPHPRRRLMRMILNCNSF